MSRSVVKTLSPEEEEEGLGVRVKRTIGGSQLEVLDPFLQLDEFTVQKPGCLPDRPSRGFETITYILQGSMKHEDFCGNEGEVPSGSIQVLSSGCGLVHSESPISDEVVTGVQIFVNIPGEHKLSPPTYQCHPSQDIPTAIKGGVKVNILVGEAFGNKSQLNCVTPVNICDITMETDKEIDVPLHSDWAAVAYILSGKLSLGPSAKHVVCLPHELAILSEGETVHLENKGTEPCRFLLMTGKPLGEEVARQGSDDIGLNEFLKSRGLEDKKIQELKKQKIDWETILVMSDEDLSQFFPTYGDKVAVVSYAKQWERKKQVNARKRTLFEKLSQKLSSKKHQTEVDGNMNQNAARQTRKIEIGWIDYNHSKKEYKQVRTKGGGGVRKVSVNKNAKNIDIIREAKNLFFPNGTSLRGKEEEFSFKVMNYQLIEMDIVSTVGDIYKCTKFSVLRFYLASTKTQVDCYTESDESESELPVCSLGDEACIVGEMSNAGDFSSIDEFPSTSLVEAACSLPLTSTPTPGSEIAKGDEVIHLSSDDSEVKFGPFSDEDIGEATLPLLVVPISNVASVGLECSSDPSIPPQLEPGTSDPIIIKRTNVLNDMMDAFSGITKDSIVKKTPFTFRVKHPNGKMEAGEGIGVTRDCISSFWEEFYSRCTMGCSVKVPFIRHDFGVSEWVTVAKIMLYGWNICGYFPSQLSVSFLEISISGKIGSGNLLEDFLSYLSDQEATILKSALQDFNSYPADDITDVLDTYGCRTIPNKDNLRTLLSEIAHKEIIQAPAFVSECWSKVLDVLDKSFTIIQVIEKLTPTNRKVSKLFTFNNILSAAQEGTKSHLLRFTRELDGVLLRKFLRFCTASDLMTCEEISVQFNERSGLSRHPVAHTCGCVLELPVTYDNYPEFRSEFKAVLESGVWVIDIV